MEESTGNLPGMQDLLSFPLILLIKHTCGIFFVYHEPYIPIALSLHPFMNRDIV